MTLPPGSWPSPISAADAVRGRRALDGVAVAGDQVWWSEGRPDEGGRVAICAAASDATQGVVDLLPAPWNARTRVHEYGGVAFLPVPAGAGHDLVFCEFTDQRLYRVSPGGEPAPLTPAPERPAGLRYADLVLDAPRNRVLCVREVHHGDGTYGTVHRGVAAVPLDGSGSGNPDAIVDLVQGADFYAAPRLDPAGRRLLYLTWNHPDMPWDRTRLHLAELTPGGTVHTDRVLLDGSGVSVTEPGFLTAGPHAGAVLAMPDTSGWWRPTVVDPDTGARHELTDAAVEFGAPLWTLGHHRWVQRPDGELVVIAGGVPCVLAGGLVTPLDESWSACSDLAVDGAGRVAAVVGGPQVSSRVAVIGVDGSVADVRLATDTEVDPAFRPPAREITVAGVHAVTYPPTHPDHAAAPGTAPYLMMVHGGPTGQASRAFSATTAFFTSRGIGVVAVDYGGSAGYGRAYRERLRGAWGEVDVHDCAALARALEADGTARTGATVIQGGSAGGWTVLGALTTPDMPFAAGISLFGVADARALARDTHDFESRYVDGLLGPDQEQWYARSPLARAEQLNTPVLLLQGGKDPIVTPDQAEAFRAVCVARGVPHALILFPQESHGFRAAQAQITTLEAQLGFLGRILGFDTPGVPQLELTTT